MMVLFDPTGVIKNKKKRDLLFHYVCQFTIVYLFRHFQFFSLTDTEPNGNLFFFLNEVDGTGRL